MESAGFLKIFKAHLKSESPLTCTAEESNKIKNAFSEANRTCAVAAYAGEYAGKKHTLRNPARMPSISPTHPPSQRPRFARHSHDLRLKNSEKRRGGQNRQGSKKTPPRSRDGESLTNKKAHSDLTDSQCHSQIRRACGALPEPKPPRRILPPKPRAPELPECNCTSAAARYPHMKYPTKGRPRPL